MKDFKKVGLEVVVRAGDFLLNEQNKVRVIKQKHKGADLLSSADRGSEEILISSIHKHFPKHGIFSEELGDVYSGSELQWIIDPLDGTKHYIKGLPFFAVSLTLRDERGPILAFTNIPITKEIFISQRDSGTFYNGDRCFVSDEDTLLNAIIYVEFPSAKFKVNWEKKDYNAAWRKYEALTRACFRTRAYGSGPIGMAYTALGAFDAYVRFQPLSYEDVLGGSLMIQEAGGKLSNQDGEELNIKGNDLNVKLIASNGKIHDQILKIIN